MQAYRPIALAKTIPSFSKRCWLAKVLRARSSWQTGLVAVAVVVAAAAVAAAAVAAVAFAAVSLLVSLLLLSLMLDAWY